MSLTVVFAVLSDVCLFPGGLAKSVASIATHPKTCRPYLNRAMDMELAALKDSGNASILVSANAAQRHFGRRATVSSVWGVYALGVC